MKVVVVFDVNADIIDCSEAIVDKIEEYRISFLDWLFDIRNEHSYWMYENGEKYGCSYRSEALVEWMNNFVLKDSLLKSKVLKSGVNRWNKNLATIFF